MASEALARKIAELMEAQRPAADRASIMTMLAETNARLDQLEAAATHPQTAAVPTSNYEHPSLNKLSIAEAIADQIFAGAGNEKACSFEPNGKHCDHCSMCNSRGF